jgi:hypothetical protein
MRATSLSNSKGRKACPRGLEKKDNGCLPPGQAKKDTDTKVMGNVGSESDHRVRHHRRLHREHHG